MYLRYVGWVNNFCIHRLQENIKNLGSGTFNKPLWNTLPGTVEKLESKVEKPRKLSLQHENGLPWFLKTEIDNWVISFS